MIHSGIRYFNTVGCGKSGSLCREKISEVDKLVLPSFASNLYQIFGSKRIKVDIYLQPDPDFSHPTVYTIVSRVVRNYVTVNSL
jgi:hypothetical protein